MRRLALCAGLAVVAAPLAARAQPVDDMTNRFVDDAGGPAQGEPSVRELQRAAERHAELQPELVESWLRRVRLAALAPQLELRAGRGLRILTTTLGSDGTLHTTVGDGSTWTFEASARWTLDRLVFDRDELRLSREAQRVAARREALLTDVAHVYFERRRLQLQLALSPPRTQAEADELRLQVDELGAMLDGLTGGALSRATGGR